jgi:methylated-DNA-protein-cysteine methyltransferase-like protein
MDERAQAMSRVWQAVRAIPRGETASYGEVARRAGLPRRARWVAVALKAAPAALRLPWHRVIGANGRIAFPAGSRLHREQALRLRAEGRKVEKGRVVAIARGTRPADLDEWFWKRSGLK